MREIKFRAWDKENNYMVDVDFLGENVVKITNAEWENIEHFEIMQYTGIKDIKGVKIYERDIVEFVRTRHQVRFVDGSFALYDRNQWHVPFYTLHGGIEVIGNIYENPELLEDKDAN